MEQTSELAPFTSDIVVLVSVADLDGIVVK